MKSLAPTILSDFQCMHLDCMSCVIPGYFNPMAILRTPRKDKAFVLATLCHLCAHIDQCDVPSFQNQHQLQGMTTTPSSKPICRLHMCGDECTRRQQFCMRRKVTIPLQNYIATLPGPHALFTWPFSILNTLESTLLPIRT